MDTEVWRGSVAAWECDEMGHLNTRFYVLRAVEGLAMLLAQLGLPGTTRADAETSFAVEDMHIRFHREARQAASLSLSGGVLEAGEDWAEVLLVMEDVAKAEVKATFRIRLRHIRPASDAALPWPEGFPARAEARRVSMPEIAAPRSTPVGPVVSRASAAAARGMARLSMGVVGPDRVDAFGRMGAWNFIGAVSDGIRSLTGPFRDIIAQNADPVPARVGGAVVEFRILHLDWPRLGDAYEVRGGLQGIEGQVQKLVFWMLDPVSGRVWGTMQSIAVNFDLDTRKVIRVSDRARALLAPLSVPGLEM
ncbi:thioesterase family protein [Pararhodobacter sp.]|uniref:thioesterase family protein n=1 Tax=Pararhodobacter sp. TaxID=2127056 RepID=UPI002FDF20F8